MDLDLFLHEIRAWCEQNGDPALVNKYTRYFVEGYDSFGVDGKLIEQQRTAWLAQHRAALGLAGFLDLGDRLVLTGKYEEASLAIGFVRAFEKEFTPLTFDRLGAWLDGGIRNWAHADYAAGDIFPQFVTRSIVPLASFEPWRAMPSKWRRRVTAVSLIKIHKGGFPTADLLALIDPLMPDREKVVQQGLGWFLREAWKRDRAPVEAFLLKWKDSCGRLIIQYATEKMTGEERERYRKSKS
jgi:3-methyladenine DNA glycosylase AlkD